MAGLLTLSAVAAVFLHMGLAERLCFTDGIPESQRINLTNGDGESYPVGIWKPTWAAGVATSAVMEVLVNEKLGFLTASGGGSATVNGFFAMAGCETPNDVADPRCGRKRTYYHLHLEGWTAGYLSTWQQIQDDYPDTAPEIVGGMGYQGMSGQYISHEVIETAYAQEGLTLEFYRSHNASWTNPSRYFDNISAFNTENIKLCNETRLMNSKAMEQYVRVTGDWDGIDNSSGTVVGKCFQGHYWFAPVCRANPMTCYPFITAGPGYAYEHQMQKAAVFNMPVAVVVAKLWSDYSALPTQVKSSFYWWEPDPTFLSLDAHRIMYRDFDASEVRAGILTTNGEDLRIDKYASADLKALAPEVYEVLSQFNMDLKTVNKLMGDQADTGDAPEVVACRWLQANKDHWESWLPDKTECFPQFGLYNELTGQFVQDRSDPTRLTCRVCASGSFSSHLKDDAGVTYVCKPCAPGSAQPSGAALKCEPCPTGEYQDKNGSTSCKRCGQGKYQDAKGQTQCKECPAATTTLGLGSASVFECGCEPGRINVANETDLPECTPCGEGLSCPFSSSLETLKLGTAPLGEQYQAALRRGFYCTMDSPLVVFKCVKDSFCPVGVPEVCSGGRVGMICAECPTGMTWTGSECTACDPSTSFLWWCCVLLLFCALVGGYYIVNPRVHAIATARQTWGVSVGLAIMWLQTVAIIAMMTVEWPSSVSGSLSVIQFFILDVDSLSFSCIASDQASARYIAKVLVFPTGMAWMCALFFISKCLPKWLQWRPAKTANTIGHYMQASFAIMSTVALQSMTCYVHPNGSYSLVKYSSITCGEGEQATMMAAGVSLLIVFVVGFLAIVTYATVALPSWSSDRAMARPWKVPLLNWVDACISVLLIQITMLSGIAVSSEAFSDVFGGIVLGMFFGIIGLMLLAVGFAVLQELCAEKDAKDSIILSMFESRSTGLGNRLLAVANGVAQHEEAFLHDVLEKLNNHDLSRLENSIDLISFELMSGDVFHAKGRIHRIHSRAIAARASVTNRNQDMVAAELPQNAAADPADPADPEPDQAISRDPQQTLTPEVAANPSSVAPVEPAVPASNEEVTVTTVTPPLPSSQEIAKAQIVSTVL